MAVGHTARSKENTGIQRVTRSLAREMLEIEPRLQLVEWHQKSSRLLNLMPECRESLSAYSGPRYGKPNWIGRLPAFLKGSLNSILQKTETAWMRSSRRMVVKPVLGSWLIMPELMTEQEMSGAVTYARSNGLKLAVIFHDAIAILHPELVNERIRRNHSGYMQEAARSDLILAVSRFSAQSFTDFVNRESIPEPAIKVCSLPGEFGNTARVLQYDPPSGENINILCVSTLEPRKNHATLLKAFESLLESSSKFPMRLVMIGNVYDGAPEIEAEVRAFCACYPQVQWLGQVGDEKLREQYAMCHFTAFPSIVEGCGLPILESLWNARPCVCYGSGAMKEIADGGGCLTADVKDPSALAHAINRLAAEVPFREKLAHEAIARNLGTWRNYARDVISHLGNIPERSVK